MKDNRAEYERRVQFYESEGICRSDAQAIVDAELLDEARTITIAPRPKFAPFGWDKVDG